MNKERSNSIIQEINLRLRNNFTQNDSSLSRSIARKETPTRKAASHHKKTPSTSLHTPVEFTVHKNTLSSQGSRLFQQLSKRTATHQSTLYNPDLKHVMEYSTYIQERFSVDWQEPYFSQQQVQSKRTINQQIKVRSKNDFDRWRDKLKRALTK